MKLQLAVAALAIAATACGIQSEPAKSGDRKTTITTRIDGQQQTEARDLHGLTLAAQNGRIDGDIGFFTGVHEGTPETSFYDDGFYTSLQLTSRRSNGDWGFASLSLSGAIADMPQGEPQITTASDYDAENYASVVGCASSVDGSDYYDMPADQVSVTIGEPDENAEIPQGEEAVAALTFLAHWDDHGATMPEQTVKGKITLTTPQ